ncbi:hypothetical protein OIDMADRAFT_22713 [Oidiodendron maius Zn]|uniref:DUF4219 domain-containing protein n=1 Tax=Oidiodendron maius (strain Zn) TaxID=913774 RepID=A0A0C3I091_OIDMZ|nr:hypothetical protein OIDMADRAFT_22713 [Oidiodendron maius Zn]
MAKNGYIDAEALRMSPSRRLMGEENYAVWKKDMMTIVTASGLDKFLVEDPTKPKEIENDKNATDEEVRAWRLWKMGDAKTRLELSHNMTSGTWELIQFEETALNCWTALETHYEWKSNSAKFKAVSDFVGMKFDHYPSLDKFIAAFRRATERLNDLDIAPPKDWYSFVFISCLSNAFPTWADHRLRQNRRAENMPSLHALIADIMHEKSLRNS